MFRITLIFLLLATLGSCSTYRIAERHLNHKMHQADLTLQTWIDPETSDTIEYWDNQRNNAPVMVLVHGFGASTKYQWSKQVKMLNEHYRLVLPNLYHFGNTRPGSGKYEVSDQVDMVGQLTEHLNFEKYTLCGVSYGALISIELAEKKQRSIEKLILFDAPVKYMDSSDIGRIQRTFHVPSIEELFVPTEPKGLKKLLYLATGKKSPVPSVLLKEFHEKSYKSNLNDKRMLITRLVASLEKYQQREYELEMPVLLIWGENDEVVPADRGKLLQQHLGGETQLYIIKGTAHMPNMTKAKKFNKILKDFLDVE